MRIAICDDCKEDIERVVKCIKQYSAINLQEFEISTFDSSHQIEHYLDLGNSFDLYFLDILIDTISGIELTRRIRKYQEDAIIVFTTSSPEFALDAFSVNAFQYLLKPITYEAFEKAFQLSLNIINKNKENVAIFKAQENNISVPLCKIEYIEYANRRLVIHLTDKSSFETVSVRTTFADTIPFKLPSNFVFCHSSFLVNIENVKRLTKNSFIMKNDVEIPIARAKYQATKQLFCSYYAK